MAKNERFEMVYSQGTLNVTEIWVDKETNESRKYAPGEEISLSVS